MSEKKNMRLRVLPVPGKDEYLLVWDRMGGEWDGASPPDNWIFVSEEVDFE